MIECCDRRNSKYWHKTCPSVALSITDSTRSGLETNTWLLGKRPAAMTRPPARSERDPRTLRAIVARYVPHHMEL